MSITDEFLEYVDPSSGLIAPTKGGGSLNGLLYTSIAMIVLSDNDLLTDDLRLRFLDAIEKCQVKPGLYRRHPENNDQEGPDDYVGLSAMSAELGESLGHEILIYGLKHFFNYNNVDGKFTGQSWLGRQLQLVTHIEYGSRCSTLTPFRLYWALSIWWSGFAKKEDQDAWILSWLLIRAFKANSSPSFFGRLAVKFWEKKMLSNFPNGLRDLPYLEGNTNHPVTRYWKF